MALVPNRALHNKLGRDWEIAATFCFILLEERIMTEKSYKYVNYLWEDAVADQLGRG